LSLRQDRCIVGVASGIGLDEVTTPDQADRDAKGPVVTDERRAVTKRLLEYLKHNLLAALALFVALGGTSYASVTIQAHPLHGAARAAQAAQGPNGIDRPLWAYVFNGTITQTSPGTTATLVHLGLGDYKMYFPGPNLANCARTANLTHIRGSVTITGYDSTNPEIHAVRVRTTAADGTLTDADFVVVVNCSPSSGQPTPDQFQ
jgi:hypothetical protein